MKNIRELQLPLKQGQAGNFPFIVPCVLFTVFSGACFYLEYPLIVAAAIGLLLLAAALFSEKKHAVVLFAFLVNTFLIFFLKNLLFRLNPFELLFLAILAVSPFLFLVPSGKKILERCPYKIHYLIVLAALFLSLVHTYGRGILLKDALVYSVKFILFFVPFYLLILILNKENFKRYLVYYLVSCVVFLVLFVLIGLRDTFWFLGRLSLPKYMHSNWICGYLEMFFPLAFFIAAGTKNTFHKIVFSIFACVLLSVMMLTYSKGGLITVSLCLGFYFIRYFSIRTFALGILLLATSVFYFYEGFAKRITLIDWAQIMSSYARIEMLKTGIKMILDNDVLFGFGINAFAKLKFQFGFLRLFDPSTNMSSHNYFLEILLGIGIVGFVAFFGMIFKILVHLYRLNLIHNSHLRYGLFFSIFSYLIHGLVDCFLVVPSFSFILFSLLAFSYFFIKYHKDLDQEPVF